MSDSDENSQITRNNPLGTEASANEEVAALTSTSSTYAVVGIPKRIGATADDGIHSSGTENPNTNSSAASSAAPGNTFSIPGSSNLARSSSILITEYDEEPEIGPQPSEEESSLPNQTQANVPNNVIQPQQNSSINPPPHQTQTYPPRSTLPPARNDHVPLIYQRSGASSRIHRYFRALIGCTDESDSFISPILPSFQEVFSDYAVRIPPSTVTSRSYFGPPPLIGAPPSYNAVMRIGPPEPYTPNRTPLRMQPSPPFIAPIPPPTYAQSQGFYIDSPIIISVEQIAFGPDPLSVICSRCAHAVVTSTQSYRSNFTHFSALILCLFGCWPCCLLPYCMDSCKRTEHSCPRCHQMLGTFPAR